MTQEHRPDASIRRAADLIAEALIELQQRSVEREALVQSTAALQQLARRLDEQLEGEREQRQLVTQQLSGLAGSIERLVNHLQELSQLMQRSLEPRAVETTAAVPAASDTPSFMPGGEGITLALSGVPGFQSLMDLQKALLTLPAIEGASVERFQEGDSRILVHLRSAITADALAADLRASTGLGIVVEEARPDLLHLRLKIVPSA